MNETKQLKPIHGIGVFVVEMILFILVAPPIQSKLGMAGVAITELMLLAIGVGAALLFKQDLKEVFPIKTPTLRDVAGTLFIWGGAFLTSMIGTLVVAVIDPSGMNEVSEGLNGMFTSVTFWISLFVVSIMPAICEEALHRGFILHTFKSVKKEWVIVLCMGIIFGIFHLDAYRFFATAVLGAGLTYVMLKTKNFLMPMFYHAFNNLLPIVLSFSLMAAVEVPEGEILEATESVTTVMTRGMAVLSLGSYLMIGMAAPFLFLVGAKLLKPKEEKLSNNAILGAAICSGVMLVLGFVIMGVAMVLYPELLNLAI